MAQTCKSCPITCKSRSIRAQFMLTVNCNHGVGDFWVHKKTADHTQIEFVPLFHDLYHPGFRDGLGHGTAARGMLGADGADFAARRERAERQSSFCRANESPTQATSRQRDFGAPLTHATCMEHYLTWTNMTYGRTSGISRVLHACILSQSGYISGKPMASSVPWRC